MLGRPVAYQLKNDGFQVRILTRVPEKAKTFFDPSFEIFKGDLRNQKEKKMLRKGAGESTSIYHGK